MKRAILAIVVLSAILLIGCTGQAGKTYVQSNFYSYGIDTWGRYTTGGFPYLAYWGVNYEFNSGSYYFQYNCWDYNGYYFGGLWMASYTVSANKGGMFWKNGEDKHINIVCWSTGPAITGLNEIPTVGQQGISSPNHFVKTYSDGDITIELEATRVETGSGQTKAAKSQN